MINGLTIRPEVFIPYRNCFVATAKFMLGDADSYPTGKIQLQNDEQVIALKNLFDHGVYTRDNGYTDSPLFETFCDLLEFGEDGTYDFFQNDYDAWGAGKFEEFSVLWYDEQGQPHAVDFWWRD